jgi:hypothetical protein
MFINICRSNILMIVIFLLKLIPNLKIYETLRSNLTLYPNHVCWSILLNPNHYFALRESRSTVLLYGFNTHLLFTFHELHTFYFSNNKKKKKLLQYCISGGKKQKCMCLSPSWIRVKYVTLFRFCTMIYESWNFDVLRESIHNSYISYYVFNM